MIDMKRYPGGLERPKTSLTIPDSQARAVDRRHQLAEQQRAFRGGSSSLASYRTRPPS